MDPPGTARYWDGYVWTTQTHGHSPLTTVPERRVAPIPHRMAARAIDLVIASLVVGSAARIWAPRGLEYEFGELPLIAPVELFSSDTFLVAGALSVVLAAIWEFLWLVAEGSTPGKQLLGLYVGDPRSPRGTVTPRVALARLAHRPLYAIPAVGVVIGLFGSGASLVLMGRDEQRRQSLMDRFAGTTVYRLPPGSPRFTPWLRVVLVTAVVLRLIALLLNWDFYVDNL